MKIPYIISMNMFSNFKKYLKWSKINFFICGSFAIASTWTLLGAAPFLRLGGMFIQIETQVIFLHSICALMLLYKVITNLFFKHKLENNEDDNLLTIIPLCIAITSLVFSILKGNFNAGLLGSPQLGQGTLWYFDLYIMVWVFSSFLIYKNARIVIFFNLILLTATATIFTVKPYFMGINLSFYNFTDYLCFYGAISFIVFTTIVKNRLILFLGYLMLGVYLLPLQNNSAYFLWAIILIIALIYYILDTFRYEIFTHAKKIFYSNIALTSYILISSFLIVLSSIILWSGEKGISDEITKNSQALSSLVVRGKIAETSLLSMFNLKSFFLGNGWGETPNLLLANMNTWHYDQLTLGYNLHFHTHNELIEHFISLGILGFLLFIILAYNIFKYAENEEFFSKLAWFFFFMLSCFWFIFLGTLPLIAVALACFFHKATTLAPNNNYYKKLLKLKKTIAIYLHSLIFILLVLGIKVGYDTIKLHHKMSPQELIAYSKKQELNIDENTYSCKNYFDDFNRGGYMLPPMINNYTNYVINIEKNNINENSAFVLKLLFCIAEDIISANRANLDLISSVIQSENRLYFSGYDSLKELISSKNDESLWEKRANKIVKLAPKRGDLLIPSMAYFLEEGKIEDVIKLCKNNKIKGIGAYCELVFANSLLKKQKLSQKEFYEVLQHLKKAVDMGIINEKVYGWWWHRSIEEGFLKGFSEDGIPLSPDLIFYVSHQEAVNISDILENYKNIKF